MWRRVRWVVVRCGSLAGRCRLGGTRIHGPDLAAARMASVGWPAAAPPSVLRFSHCPGWRSTIRHGIKRTTIGLGVHRSWCPAAVQPVCHRHPCVPLRPGAIRTGGTRIASAKLPGISSSGPVPWPGSASSCSDSHWASGVIRTPALQRSSLGLPPDRPRIARRGANEASHRRTGELALSCRF